MKQMSQEEIVEQVNILKQKPFLRRQERRYLEKLERKLNNPQVKNPSNWKNLVAKTLALFAGISIIIGLVWYIMTRPNLPPIDMAGHIEVNPPSHIMDKEMDESIQKHMLEHADGKGKPGVIIQYNCKKFSCEKDFVKSLSNLVKKYPENVYLAPGKYDGKVILTRLGKREILSSFNDKKIVAFIEGN